MKDLLPISRAADILGVSIDTVRRWDKSGKLHSVRPDGKNRYFSLKELVRFKQTQPLTISEAAEKLGVSASTLRRYEARGLIRPARNKRGERAYTKETLSSFLNLKPSIERVPQFIPKVPVKEKREIRISLPILELKNLGRSFKKPKFSFAQVALGLLLILTSSLSFRYLQDHWSGSKQQFREETARVLGIADETQGVLTKVSSFLTKIGSNIVDEVKLAFAEKGIRDINQVFEFDEEGNLVPKVALNITQPELLKIKETKIVQNLNAETVRGKAPGDEEGDLAYFVAGGRIPALRLSALNLPTAIISGGSGGVISDSSITADDLATDAVTSSKILNDTIKNEDLADGLINAAKIEDGTITAADLKDGTISEAKLADNLVTTGKIADNTISASDLAATLTFADGDLLNLSAIDHSTTSKMGLILPNVSSASPSSPSSGEGFLAYDTSGDQVLVYDGSSWAQIGGAVTLSSSGETTTTSSNSGLEFDSEELSLLRGCSAGQILKWNETTKVWACGNDSGAGGSGISVVEKNNVDVVTTAASLDFSSDFSVTLDTGEAENEADIAIDYTGSGLTRKGQSESVSGDWTFGGTLTINGDITANDASADTILIGQSGATDDTVTIAGNVSLTDDDWSISAAGVATGLSGITADAVAFSGVSAATNTNALVIGTGGSLSSSGTGTITATDLSCTDCIGSTEISELTLGTDTAGNYIDNVTGGSGIDITGTAGEGWEPAVALGDLTADWSQSGAFDIVLNHASSELKIKESAGDTYYGTLEVGDLGANATYTFSGTTGTVLTSANYTTTLDDDYVDVDESPASADISGSFQGGLTINSGAVAAAELAATITWTDGDLVDFSSVTPNTATEGLKLVQGTDCTAQTAEGLICWDSDNEKLYVGNSTGVTEIGSGGTSTLQQAYEAGNTISITSAEGALGMTATSANFDITVGSGTDTGDFRIYDGTDNWFFIDESGDTLAMGGAAGSGITIGGANVESITLTTNSTGDAEVELPNGSINTDEILDNTVSATDLAATITFADGDLIDFSSVTPNTATEGLKLVQSTDCSNQTAEGLICWDSDNEKLYVGNSTGVTEINSSAGASTLQQAYEAGNTISITSAEGALSVTATSANLDFAIGSGTDTGDFRIWDGATNWFFIDESGDTLALGAAAGSGITIGASGITTTNAGALTVSEALTANGAVTFNTDVDLTFGGTENLTISNTTASTTDVVALSATITDTNSADAVQITIIDDTSSSGSARGLVIETGDGAASLDAALAINHTDTTQAMTAGVIITGAGSTAITTAVDVSDAEIGTALAIGTNDITTGATTLASTELDLLDSGVNLSELTDSGTLTVTTGTVDINQGNIDGVTIGASSPAAATVTTLTANTKITVGDASGNDYLEFIEEATNPTCGAGDYFIWANSGDTTLKKCQNGSITNLDTGGGGGAWSDLTNPTGPLSLTHAANTTTMGWTATGALDAWTNNFNNNAGSITTQRVMSIINTITAQTADVNTEALLRLDNADTSASGSTVVDDAILITVSGTLADGIVDAIDASDANITNAINIGTNNIVTGAATIASIELDLLDSGITLGELTDSGTLTAGTVDINGGNIDGTAIGSNSTSTGAFTTISASGAIAANGGITFDNATDTLGAFTAAGNIDLNTSYILTNIGSSGTNFSGTGGLTLADTLTVSSGGASVTDGGITIVAGALAVNSDSITSDGTLTINASNIVRLGDATNYFQVDETSGPTYAGTARPTKRITLSPEYAGATLTGDGSNNTGTMTSDNETATNWKNYYNWTTSETGTSQDYDIWVRVPLPADFDAFTSSDAVTAEAYSDNLANTTIEIVQIYDTANTADCIAAVSIEPGTVSTWADKTTDQGCSGGTYAANGIMTIQLRLGSISSANARVGRIYLEYYAKF